MCDAGAVNVIGRASSYDTGQELSANMWRWRCILYRQGCINRCCWFVWTAHGLKPMRSRLFLFSKKIQLVKPSGFYVIKTRRGALNGSLSSIVSVFYSFSWMSGPFPGFCGWPSGKQGSTTILKMEGASTAMMMVRAGPMGPSFRNFQRQKIKTQNRRHTAAATAVFMFCVPMVWLHLHQW